MSREAANDRIEWARSHMPMLAALKRELETSRPFADTLIGICLHVEPKTAVLCSVLQAGGAELAITGSPGTTVDDVARRYETTVFRSTDVAPTMSVRTRAISSTS